MTGTTIRLDKANPDGWDFGICTATSFDRYQQYEEEMSGAFQRIIAVLIAMKTNDKDKAESRSAALSTHVLELFFYWVHFTPITRGTSASGYAAILACGKSLSTANLFV